MMFSKSCTYGIRAILYLSLHSNEEKKIGVQEIAESLNAPKHFLAKILQELSKNNLITSVKGPNGGFYLSDKDKQRPLIDIVECIDGPSVMRTCILGLPVCSDRNPCPLHSKARHYRDGLLELIAEQSIDELSKTIEEKQLRI